ncbi:unnamed protein product [Ambrosiozyma monospora]|uniref:Unnamed protein product n=1 Tax=Ambrosiozyma monospora TaxID=43982 RepID=A0ACB5SS39_AMBMO|nr:unnamed protein product [Ambrosiozyma monospora]
MGNTTEKDEAESGTTPTQQSSSQQQEQQTQPSKNNQRKGKKGKNKKKQKAKKLAKSELIESKDIDDTKNSPKMEPTEEDEQLKTQESVQSETDPNEKIEPKESEKLELEESIQRSDHPAIDEVKEESAEESVNEVPVITVQDDPLIEPALIVNGENDDDKQLEHPKNDNDSHEVPGISEIVNDINNDGESKIEENIIESHEGNHELIDDDHAHSVHSSEIELKNDNAQGDTKEADTHPIEAKIRTEIEVSDGPFSLIELIKDVPLHNPDIPQSETARVTCIEAWDLNIYIGTSIGEIIHMYKIDEELGYIQISRQRFSSTKMKPILKILLLPEISKALVQCGSTVSAYILPELSPANIGKIKEVTDMSIDYNEVELDANKHNYITPIDHIEGDVFVKVTIFTKKSIRLVRVFAEGIRLFKDVHYPQAIQGAQRSSFAAVGTHSNYDLIDLNQVQKIPLFSLTSTPPTDETPKDDILKPYIIPVGTSEFLMTCGSTKKEPAIGMVVNLNGDVSRGTITLDSYPTSLAVDFPYTLSVFEETHLKVYSLHDQKQYQAAEFPDNSKIKLKSVSHIFDLKDDNMSKNLTKIPIISKMTDDDIERTAVECDN